MSAIRGCAVCNELIEEERAENDPETELCQIHAKEITKYGGEFKPKATDERTSKSTSMKINYGSVSVERVRNKEAVKLLREDYLDKQCR